MTALAQRPPLWLRVWQLLSNGYSVAVLYSNATSSEDLAHRASALFQWLAQSQIKQATATELQMANDTWVYARKPVRSLTPAMTLLLPTDELVWVTSDE